MSATITIATRRSRLALAQTALVRAALTEALPDVTVEVIERVTTGDRQSGWSLEKEGGKGLFTKELEEALLAGEADLAVHSAKDLPTELPEGLVLAGFLPREDPRDVLVKRAGVEAPATIATGSPRRRAQAARLFPQATFGEIRGNVETRLRKIAEEGTAEATFLAVAGLRRLGIAEWEGLVFEPVPVVRMVPAVGQAAIALQCRAGEEERFAAICCAPTAAAVSLERALLARLGGGCHSAHAAHYDGAHLHLFHQSHGYRCLENVDAQASEADLDTVVEKWIQP